jgi:hypothetical protein
MIGLLSWRCKCHGNMLFEFYAGKKLLATVSYHHGESLFWRDGKWSGNAELTDARKVALDDWLQVNGCPTIDEAESLTQATWEATKGTDAGE